MEVFLDVCLLRCAVDEIQHFGDHIVKKKSCKSGNGRRRVFNTEHGTSACISS